MSVFAALLLAATGPSGASIERPATTWLSPDDYPAEAMRAGEEGRVVVDLKVDRDGVIAGCVVKESSGSASLDATTCRLFTERARFAPARDERGRPIAATVAQSIRWVLPREPLADQQFAIRMTLARGRVVSCVPTGNFAEAFEEQDPCATYSQPAGLRAMLGAAFDGARSIELALSVTVGDQPPPARAGRRIVFADALFTLGKGGKIADCRLRSASAIVTAHGDFCKAMSADPTTFDGKPGDMFTVLFAATVE